LILTLGDRTEELSKLSGVVSTIILAKQSSSLIYLERSPLDCDPVSLSGIKPSPPGGVVIIRPASATFLPTLDIYLGANQAAANENTRVRPLAVLPQGF